MADFNETAEFVRRTAEKMRDVIALGDALKEIGSISQAATEQQAALDKVNADIKTANDNLAAVKVEHQTFLAGREKDIAAHQTAVDEIVDKANQDAADIKSKAETAAKTVMDAANVEVGRIQDGHAETMKAAAAELQDVQARTATANDALAAVQAEHDALVEKIQKMKDLARTALGPNGH